MAIEPNAMTHLSPLVCPSNCVALPGIALGCTYACCGQARANLGALCIDTPTFVSGIRHRVRATCWASRLLHCYSVRSARRVRCRRFSSNRFTPITVCVMVVGVLADEDPYFDCPEDYADECQRVKEGCFNSPDNGGATICRRCKGGTKRNLAGRCSTCDDSP